MYFILYSDYSKIGNVCRGIKTIPKPQEFYNAGTSSPGFEIPGSATVGDMVDISHFYFLL